MTPDDLKKARQGLGFTQTELAERLRTTRMTITRYECGTRRIPGLVEVAIKQLAQAPRVSMAGVVMAGNPIEPVPQSDAIELVEIPPSMARSGENFALRVKGDSMRDEGILPDDLVIVHKQATARNGQTVVALINNEATIKRYVRKAGRIELHPANPAMHPILVSPDDDFRIQGVVIGVIRHCT
jgi:repressor LexA